MKNILITGGAGFIGSNLAQKLSAAGYAVTVLDNLSEQIHGKNPDHSTLYQSILGQVIFIKGDINCRADVEKAIEGQDAVIHLAAETGTGQSMYHLEKYSSVNVGGTALLLDVLVNRKNKVQKFILASSRAVYGEGKYLNALSETLYPASRSVAQMRLGNFEITDQNSKVLETVGTDENSKIHPGSFYGLTKFQQEQMVKLVCESIGISYVILRYQNVYGIGQSLQNPYTGILSIFSTQILNGDPLNIFEDGLMTRDFINIEDTVEATIKSLERDSTNNETINLGTGIATSVLSVAQRLIEVYAKDIVVNISGDFRLGDIRHHFADIEKAERLLDFEPKIKFNQGIETFAKWVLNQPKPENHLEASLAEMKEKGFFK